MASALKPGDIVTAYSPKSDKHGAKGWYKQQKKRVSVCYPGNTTRHFAPKNLVKYEGDAVEEITSCKEYQEFIKQHEGGEGGAPTAAPTATSNAAPSCLSMEQLAEAILGVADEQESQGEEIKVQAEQLEVQATVMKGLTSRMLVVDQLVDTNWRLMSKINERLADYDRVPPLDVPAKRARQKNLGAALIEE